MEPLAIHTVDCLAFNIALQPRHELDAVNTFLLRTGNGLYHGWNNSELGPGPNINNYDALYRSFTSQLEPASWAANRQDVFGIRTGFALC